MCQVQNNLPVIQRRLARKSPEKAPFEKQIRLIEKYGYIRVIKYPEKHGKFVRCDILQDYSVRITCPLLSFARGLKVFLEFRRLAKEKMRVNFKKCFFHL